MITSTNHCRAPQSGNAKDIRAEVAGGACDPLGTSGMKGNFDSRPLLLAVPSVCPAHAVAPLVADGQPRALGFLSEYPDDGTPW